MTRLIVLATLLLFAAPAHAADYAVPPKKVVLRYLKVGKQRFDVRATVVLRKGQTGDCAGGTAHFTAVHRGSLDTTFDAKCHADITVKANPGTRLRVRFGGTDTLGPKRSKTIRLRRH